MGKKVGVMLGCVVLVLCCFVAFFLHQEVEKTGFLYNPLIRTQSSTAEDGTRFVVHRRDAERIALEFLSQDFICGGKYEYSTIAVSDDVARLIALYRKDFDESLAKDQVLDYLQPSYVKAVPYQNGFRVMVEGAEKRVDHRLLYGEGKKRGNPGTELWGNRYQVYLMPKEDGVWEVARVYDDRMLARITGTPEGQMSKKAFYGFDADPFSALVDKYEASLSS